MKSTDLVLNVYFRNARLDTGEIGIRKLVIVVPLFGAAYAAPNKGTTIL